MAKKINEHLIQEVFAPFKIGDAAYRIVTDRTTIPCDICGETGLIRVDGKDYKCEKCRGTGLAKVWAEPNIVPIDILGTHLQWDGIRTCSAYSYILDEMKCGTPESSLFKNKKDASSALKNKIDDGNVYSRFYQTLEEAKTNIISDLKTYLKNLLESLEITG